MTGQQMMLMLTIGVLAISCLTIVIGCGLERIATALEKIAGKEKP